MMRIGVATDARARPQTASPGLDWGRRGHTTGSNVDCCLRFVRDSHRLEVGTIGFGAKLWRRSFSTIG